MTKTPADKALSYAREAWDMVEIDPLPTRQILVLIIRALMGLAHAQIAREARTR